MICIPWYSNIKKYANLFHAVNINVYTCFIDKLLIVSDLLQVGGFLSGYSGFLYQ